LLKVVHHGANVGLGSPDEDNTIVDELLGEVKVFL
jgi:hypothetical protein